MHSLPAASSSRHLIVPMCFRCLRRLLRIRPYISPRRRRVHGTTSPARDRWCPVPGRAFRRPSRIRRPKGIRARWDGRTGFWLRIPDRGGSGFVARDFGESDHAFLRIGHFVTVFISCFDHGGPIFHGFKILGHDQVRFGSGLNLFDGEFGVDFRQHDAFRGNLHDAHFGYDHVHGAFGRQRQRTFLEDLGAPLAVCSMARITLSAPVSRSIAPPMPGAFLPGMIQLARSPFSSTCKAPSTEAFT